MKKKPFLFIILGVLAAGGYLYLNAASLITRTAEKIASDALGVGVNIGSIDVSLADKKVTVSNLQVGNPPGYRSAHAMAAEEIAITLNTASKELINFQDIQVKGSVVNLEVNEKGMNLNDLKALANRKEQKESVGSEQVRVIIEQMAIGASVINPHITLAGQDISQPIKMPSIRFSNIGKGSANGMTAGDAITHVMGKYLSAVESAAREGGMLGALPGVDGVKKTLDGAADELQKMFR